MSWLSKLAHEVESALKPEVPTLVTELDTLVEKYAAANLPADEVELLHSLMSLLINHLNAK